MQQLNAVTTGRLDAFIAQELQISRSLATRLIEQGSVRINNAVAHKPSTKIVSDDVVDVDYTPTTAQELPDLDLTILFEDDDCIVLEKPAGVLTHSKGVFNPEATVASFIANRIQISGDRAGIVHRLDRITSGVIICSKTDEAHSWLQKQFSTRKTKKTYLAIIEGKLADEQAIIDMPIERNPKKPQTFRVGVNGKPAQTTYAVLETNDAFSLVRLEPYTGRTHQLRVHMSNLGHPIVGDTLYGAKPADRVYLHAASLEITLPSRSRKRFESPMPQEFSSFMRG